MVRPAAVGGVLLQDLPVAGVVLGQALRTRDPRRRRPGESPKAGRSRPLRPPVHPLRGPGDRRRPRRHRRRTGRRQHRCAGDAVRRTIRTRRFAADGNRRRHQWQASVRVARGRADQPRIPCHPAAPHNRLRLVPRQHDRSCGAPYRPCRNPRPQPAARTPVAGARTRGHPGDRCHRAPAGLSP